ncbi:MULTISPECIES: TonB-dependent receptor [Dyella]|uniref:TonB-dependent receptor n=2 Tax=Dyella TaxID=231454 RepID=A0A4R0YV63_9GAMM|nr:MULTISPECIES: TonB-dependent receptor [Dyella]TBR40057.1 TonB-dependent receptor [Dyella terrae]TCI12361.1 TonB-dependent receptor [Dyella soli]
MSFRSLNRAYALRHTALAAALALGMTGTAFAQSTTGNIIGQAEAGDTVTVTSATGLTRQVQVDASGRYSVNNLPVGNYSVTLQKGGAAVDTRKDVSIKVGSSTDVSFASAANASSLSAVTVTANALPAIDVTGVDSRTVITSEQLARLPLARSAEAIALLAPGVVQGSGYFSGNLGGPVVSFGGSSVTENAYYINGFNTTDPLSGFGGLSLPYGAIDQQEILQGGYSAAYGRSDGGVISQVGKRGTNEWHFGGQVLWTPIGGQSDPKNYYYVKKDGSPNGMRQFRNDNKSWTTTVDAYVGGPLIKDKLFFFAAVEGQRQEGKGASLSNTAAGTGPDTAPRTNVSKIDSPKYYAKLDWNITDSNILEITSASSKSSYSGVLNQFDYATLTNGAFANRDTQVKNGANLYSGKFTSYITDDLTLSVMYGKMKGTYYSYTPDYDTQNAYVFQGDQQNPDLNGGRPITGPQTTSTISLPGHKSTNTNLRVDLSYKLGDHTLTAGIDNQDVRNTDAGTMFPSNGLGYAWEYNAVEDPGTFIIGGPGTTNNGADWHNFPWVANTGSQPGGETGYYVAKYRYHDNASVRVAQRAQYIEDTWQINDRWMVKLGLRNDQFTNYSAAGEPYLRLTKPQWAPRVGFSWDVNGDSSFKVYGNAGRYYLAMPTSVALRSAGSSLYTRQYYTYTGIDANGAPTGLTPIATSLGADAPFSANGEYGQPRDPKLSSAKDLKSEYQDEFILGFDKKLNDSFNYGAKATFRKLRNAIDDIADSPSILQKMNEMGIDPNSYDPGQIPGSILINPGKSATFYVPKLAGGYYEVPMDWKKDFGFNTTMKRKYYGLDLYLEHPFDGKWYGKVDYLWSHSFGNSEGQVRSDIGQADVSATMDWDYASIMDYANGALANDRRHQIKAYGSYQIAPEWMLSGNVAIASGAPIQCLGAYGPDGTFPGLGYGPYYHFCGGEPSIPGEKRTPWTYRLDLSAEYRPDWADKKLGFNVMIYNVFNSQKVTQYYGISTSKSFMRPITTQPARYVRFGVTYDF